MNTTTTPARWYSVNRDGMATLCASEKDAREIAARFDLMFPPNAPHTATVLAPPVLPVPLSANRLHSIAIDAQTAFCLGKQASFELAFARGIEAAHGIKEQSHG